MKYSFHEYDSTEDDTYTYDGDGNIVKKHCEPGGMDMVEPYDETYKNTEVDEHGNWTKREVSSTDGTTRTETRKIVYY